MSDTRAPKKVHVVGPQPVRTVGELIEALCRCDLGARVALDNNGEVGDRSIDLRPMPGLVVLGMKS